ncbi:MAG: hypothetical protein VCB25_00315 [Myxococcota bacterium]
MNSPEFWSMTSAARQPHRCGPSMTVFAAGAVQLTGSDRLSQEAQLATIGQAFSGGLYLKTISYYFILLESYYLVINLYISGRTDSYYLFLCTFFTSLLIIFRLE